MKSFATVVFLLALILSGCESLSPSPTPTPATQLSTLIPVPTATFSPPSHEDLATAENFAMNMQAVVAIYNGYHQVFETISFADAIVGKKGLTKYVLIYYSKIHQVYVAVSFPSNFQIGKYNITQALGSSYTISDPSNASAIFRDLPAEFSAFGEPETEGKPCNQFVFGQVTITNMRPLQGNFQFNCQFEDGVLSAVSGVFSQ